VSRVHVLRASLRAVEAATPTKPRRSFRCRSYHEMRAASDKLNLKGRYPHNK
jgi:hypothetical protein